MESEESAIQRFYGGRTVLVTGGTGFMGKVLIEKLLRATDVRKVYMLVRAKKGKSMQQRASEYFDEPLFSRLKEEGRDYLSRVASIEGDASQIGLGIRPEDKRLLQDEVEIVFHCAATVRFDETLDNAVYINVRGTKELLLITRNCSKLKVFVHVSTAYANCTVNEIYEDFFESPMTGDNAIQLVDCLSKDQAVQVTRTICGDYPNSYAFSKAIAEDVVKVYGQGLPVVIFRPAIVVSTAEEPVKGWIDNIYGPTGVQVGVGAGVLRTFQVNVDFVAELVPVDMAGNAILASAWDRSCRSDDDEMLIYNYVSSCQNPLVWGQFTDISLRYGRETPTIYGLWYYMTVTTKYSTVFHLYKWLLHLLPALVVDTVLLVSRKKPKMWKIYKKIHKFSAVIAFFSTNEWRFHNSRVLQLWERMSEKDRQLFNFDISTLDWEQFLRHSCAGLRASFFKDTPDTIPAGRRKQFRFFLLHHALVIILFVAVAWMLWKTFSVATTVFTSPSTSLHLM